MIRDFISFGLILFVLYGYFSYIHNRFNINKEVLPIITFSGISVVIFLAGILNIMELTWLVIVMFGCFLTIHSIKKKYKYKINAGVFCLLFLSVYLLLFLREQIFFAYDNFSHWGMIVKSLCYESRFPNFESRTILFQSYPVGSACFIWFICKFFGFTEGHALFAQAVLTLSCSGPLFAFSNNEGKVKKMIMTMGAFICALIMTTYSAKIWVGIDNLLVDGLLSTVAIAAFAIVYLYKEKIDVAVWSVLPLLILEVCIKNSGIVWVLAILIEITYFSWRKIEKKEWIKYVTIIVGVTGSYLYLWKKHIDIVFANAESSTHSMSIENYKKILASKSNSDIKYICEMFIKRCFSLEDELPVLLILLIILCVFMKVFFKQIFKSTHLLFCLIFCLVVSSIYQIGNLVMYIFSMPVEEANRLAGYTRYLMTLELFILGVIFVISLQIIKHINWNSKWYLQWKELLITLLILLGILWNSGEVREWVVHEQHTGRELSRSRMDDIVRNNNLEEGKKALVYISGPNDRDVGYRWHMSMYLLWSRDVKTVNTENINQLDDFDKYDYLIILDKDSEISKWLSDNGFDENAECIKTADLEYIKAADEIRELRSDQHVIFISVKDDASNSFTEEIAQSMHDIGLRYDLLDCYRKGYIAILDGNNIIFEDLSDERLEYDFNMDGKSVEIVSAGFSVGNESKIIIDGIDYSNNSRGMNIVIYDKIQQKVVDSICFDTWKRDGRYVIK